MNPVLRSALARTLSFAPAALGTLLASRLIISHFGIAAFNAFSLIIALIAVLPLNDLGVGAAVTSAYAADGVDSSRAYRVTLTATRVLAVSTLVTTIGAVVVTVLDGWPDVIGGAAGPNAWTGAAVTIFALAFVPGLGASMLLGVHRNHVTVLVQTLQAPLILAAVALLCVLGGHVGLLLLAPPTALLVINVATAALGSRATGISWRRLVRDVVAGRRRRPGGVVRALAGPVLVTSIATPIAVQLDRIVLSHVSSSRAVAEYSVAAQIFAPALALVAAAASPLWPIWQRARSMGEMGPGVGRTVVLFASVAAAMGAGLALLANPIALVIGDGRIHLGVLLPIAGALTVVITGLAWPLAMYLMDPLGARFVAWCVVVALPINVVLSIYLARAFGAAGPLLATVIVGAGVQCLPCIAFIRRRSAAPVTGRADRGGAPASR